jgi:hypothetical protein
MVRVKEPEHQFDKSRFEAFCRLYQLEFPNAFVEYLQAHNDAQLEVNILDLGDNECCVRYFYGTSLEFYSDIRMIYEDYQGRIPAGLIPIADPDFGNLICMSLDKAANGKIYFWDHEIADLKEIAPSFDALLASIKESPYTAEPAEKAGFWSKLFGKFQFF